MKKLFNLFFISFAKGSDKQKFSGTKNLENKRQNLYQLGGWSRIFVFPVPGPGSHL